jgi:curved DNA-binding protein CbpA
MRDFREQNYYELLEVKPHASSQELERSYKRARRFFSSSNVATYALFQPDELNLLRRRIEEAYRVLSDPERRQRYDSEMVDFRGQILSTPPPPREPPPEIKAEVPEAPAAIEDLKETDTVTEQVSLESEAEQANEPAKPPVPEEKVTEESKPPPQDLPPPMPVITEGTEYTGDLLRQVREARQISLEKIADVTKIAIYYLRSLESESFEDLPAEVYVRGYLRQIAKLLGLDPAEVTTGYLQRLADQKE